jgi:hypothetical protein
MCNVTFIVCIVLCALFFHRGVIYALHITAVPLPLVKTSFTGKIIITNSVELSTAREATSCSATR